jgi:hypothetical protein
MEKDEDTIYIKLIIAFLFIVIILLILHHLKVEISRYKNENSRISSENSNLYEELERIKERSIAELDMAKKRSFIELERIKEHSLIIEQKNMDLKHSNSIFEEQIKSLERRQDITDAKKEAKKIKKEIEKKLNSAICFYHETMEQARRRSEALLKNTDEELPFALETLKKAESLKNIIEGYGTRYIIPGYSVFDELACEYSFDESGQQLKLARERTRMMINQEKAANCGYAERYRRKMAIGFVIDAFNGKVDTILASAKTDNAELLIQKINDAYRTVNHLGSSFRNAHINEDYLDSRIDELKWLIRVNELIQRRKDEQREMKEEERDAARGRRESEKELLKAQKEIIRLDSERNEIMLQLREAHEEERENLVNKLRELEDQLKEKEIVSTRAKSMAETGTTIGTVYIISNRGSFGNNVFKIGLTRRLDPEERVHELFSPGLPFPFDIHTTIPSDNAPLLERELQNKFAIQRTNKVNTFKEFFNVSCLEIKEAVESLGISANWTIEAKAQQYEESLKINRQLEDGSLSKDEYLKKWKKPVSTKINEEENEAYQPIMKNSNGMIAKKHENEYINNHIAFEFEQYSPMPTIVKSLGGYDFTQAQLEVLGLLSDTELESIGKTMSSGLRGRKLEQALFNSHGSLNRDWHYLAELHGQNTSEEQDVMREYFLYDNGRFENEEEIYLFFDASKYLNEHPDMKKEMIKNAREYIEKEGKEE